MIPLPFIRATVTVIGILGTVYIAAKGIQSGNAILLALPIAFFSGMFFVANPAAIIILFVGLKSSMVTLPILPSGMNLSRCFILAFVGLTCAKALALQDIRVDKSKVSGLVLLYGGVIVLHMFIRGFGLRILGGDSWGGVEAIAQLLFVALFVFRNSLILTERQWLFAFILSVFAASVPMMADLVYILSHGRIVEQFAFVQMITSALLSGYHSPQFGGIWRLQRAAFFGLGMLHLSYFLLVLKRLRPHMFGALIGVAALLIGLSGHRLVVAKALVFVFSIYILRYPGRRVRATVRLSISMVLIYITLFFGVRYLPVAIQRSVAFVPGIPVATLATYDAAGTTKWRIILWKRSLKSWRQYFWVGKGLSIDPQELQSVERSMDIARMYGRIPDFFARTIALRDYHNGPIALLLDLGIGGLLLGLLIPLVLLREGFKVNDQWVWNSEQLRILHTILLANFISQVVIFVMLYGDVRSIMNLLFSGTLLAGIRASDKALAEAHAETSA